ncbi:hypothetical protein [Flagellimonas sp. S3867]|uniref:hypothetical protein n=1 Tax=Flagellimonas sp. S3867 TaxID=2768063 RepID=UPI001683E238|nr:hypothetical protein [Flagellimonas sp. S3867]
MNINSNERFVRWQQILRDHFSYLKNLILIFSVSTLGFLLSFLKDEEFNPYCWEKTFFTFGMLLTVFSVIFGLASSISRLMDFKATTKKIKNELKFEDENEEIKRIMAMYGNYTWYLFYLQLLFFGLATVAAIVAFCMIYSEKLF